MCGNYSHAARMPKSKVLLRTDDVPTITIESSRPIGLQMDGDYIGLREKVEFTSVPDALEVFAPITT